MCNRCIKAGHDCKYRDQADLLFRNQTAVAAQKAEDSWRKRSRSHQRAGSEYSTRQPSPGDLQSPPKTQQNSPGEPPSEPCAPIIDFNNFSIAPGTTPNLRRLAYERFIYDFVVFETPNKLPEDPSDAIWDFIPHLYQTSKEGTCLTTVVDAIAYANFSNRCNAPQALHLAEECLGKGIKLLQGMIADKEQATSDEALCSVYLMGVYEVC